MLRAILSSPIGLELGASKEAEVFDNQLLVRNLRLHMTRPLLLGEATALLYVGNGDLVGLALEAPGPELGLVFLFVGVVAFQYSGNAREDGFYLVAHGVFAAYGP